MSDLDFRVRALHPGKVNGIDYLLRDDGAGPFLDLWAGPEPEPSAAALAAVSQAAIDAVRAGDADTDAEAAIRANPAWLAVGRIMTGNDALTEDALVTLVRAKLP